MNEPAVASRNKLILFWLATCLSCLGITYFTAQHFTFNLRAPHRKIGGALHWFCRGHQESPSYSTVSCCHVIGCRTKYRPYRIHIRKKNRNVFALKSIITWFDFHLSKAQRVVVTSPMTPLHTVSVGRVIASQIESVQVGKVTTAVPPGAFVPHCTRLWPHVVVLVSSAEIASTMIAQRVTFKQHTNTDTTRQLFAILAQAPTS